MALTLEAAKALKWGTYGKDAVEDHAIFGKPLPEVEVMCLDDLSDSHLKCIFSGQTQIGDEYREAIIMILADRHEILGPKKIRRREAVEATKAKLK